MKQDLKVGLIFGYDYFQLNHVTPGEQQVRSSASKNDRTARQQCRRKRSYDHHKIFAKEVSFRRFPSQSDLFGNRLDEKARSLDPFDSFSKIKLVPSPALPD